MPEIVVIALESRSSFGGLDTIKGGIGLSFLGEGTEYDLDNPLRALLEDGGSRFKVGGVAFPEVVENCNNGDGRAGCNLRGDLAVAVSVLS